MESTTSKEAYEEDKRISDDLEARKAAIAQEIHDRDQVQSIYEAREEGIKAGKAKIIKEIALNMHSKQYSIGEITAATDLSVEEIVRIVKSAIP